MTQRKFDHLTNLCKLLLASTKVLITDVISSFLIFTFYWLALAMDGCVWSHNAELARFNTNDLELHWAETTTAEEEIALTCRSVRLKIIGLQVRLEKITGDALDRVIDREHMNALSVGHVATSMD
jgi:hypothetical protein